MASSPIANATLPPPGRAKRLIARRRSVLLAAHGSRPDLGLARQAVDADGKPVWLEPRKKLGKTKHRPKLVGIGTPTRSGTRSTWHKRQGVPEEQIDAAAGHSEQGTGASHIHLRPQYLQEFTASSEAIWAAVGEFTDAHCVTNVVALTGVRVRRNAPYRMIAISNAWWSRRESNP